MSRMPADARLGGELHVQLDEAGDSMPLLDSGYGWSDVFYESGRAYNFVRTCNEWTGEALRTAGIRMGVWTPLSQGIMWRLEREESE